MEFEFVRRGRAQKALVPFGTALNHAGVKWRVVSSHPVILSAITLESNKLLGAAMRDRFYGVGSYLYWQGDTNWENCWFPPLPPSRLEISDVAICFTNIGSSQSIPIESIVLIRKNLRPIRYYDFIAVERERGSKLCFMPIFDKTFSEMVQERFAGTEVQVVRDWWNRNENEDRKLYNLPERPTG